MISNFMKNSAKRSLLAGTLAVLIAIPWGTLMAATSTTSAQEEKYMKMSDGELLAEQLKIQAEFDKVYNERYRALQDLCYKQLSEIAIETSYIMTDLDSKTARIQVMEKGIENHLEDAKRNGRILNEVERDLLKELRRQIAQLRSEVTELEFRSFILDAEKESIEKSARPRIDALKEAYAKRMEPLENILNTIQEVSDKRFRPTTSPAEILEIADNPSARNSIRTYVTLKGFEEMLFKEWGGSIKNSPCPESFWAVGLEEYWDIETTRGGKRYCTFYRDAETAARYSGKSSAAGASIHELKTADLMKTSEGRIFLQEFMKGLSSQPDSSIFKYELPNDKIYREVVLEKVSPRPRFLVPLEAGNSPRPPESRSPVSEAGLSKAEMVKQNTLNQGLNQHILQTNPEIRAAHRSEYLVEPEVGREYVTQNIHRDMQNTLHEITLHESSEVQNEITKKVNEIADKHIPKAVEACVEQGKKTLNMQEEGAMKRLARARQFLSERFQMGKETFSRGQESIGQSRMPWHHWGVALLFTVVALYDVAYIAYEEGWEAAVWPAVQTMGMFALFMVAIPFITGINVILGEAVAGTLVTAGLWHLWKRFQNFQLWEQIENWEFRLIDASSVEPILGNKRVLVMQPATPPFKPYGIWYDIGFFTFPGSPAAGLSRDTWHHEFPSQPELLNAIIKYQYNLNASIGDPGKVPPEFNREGNLRVATRIIENEWVRKYQEDFKKIREAIEESGARQRRREKNLRYKLSRAKPPDPEGHILRVEINPEAPTEQDNAIAVKAFYAVTGLPGDELPVSTNIRLVNEDTGRESEPIINTEDIEYGISEAHFIDAEEGSLELSGPGDYELTFSLDLEPKGKNPKPHKLRFTIEEEDVKPPWEIELPVPVNFREDDIRSIDPLFTGASVKKVEDVAYHMSFQSGPIASIDGHGRLDQQNTGGFAFQHFEISQYPREGDAQESYNGLQEVLAKYNDEENFKFDNDPSRMDCTMMYTSRGTDWVNYKAISTVSTILRAGYVYRDVFWIDCYIQLNRDDYDSLSKRWQSIRKNSERLIDARLGEIK